MSKRQSKYNSLWDKDHLWLQKCKNDQFSVYCKICKNKSSVSSGGIYLVKQHEQTKTHISRTEELCNQLTFHKGSGIVVELDMGIQFSDAEKITRADNFQVFKYVVANQSIQSANDEEKRFNLMFPDSQIAKGYNLNETKMRYTIQFGIPPQFRDLLKDDLKNIP